MKKTFFLMLFGLGLQAQMYVKKDNSYQSNLVSHTTMNATSRNPLNSITEDGSFFWLDSSVSKYLPNGSQDMTFGVNGSLSVVANDLTLASLIKVVNNNLYVYAYNTYVTNPVPKVGKFGFNGTKNTSFGNNGILTFSGGYVYGFNEMVENTDQSLFVVASNNVGVAKKILKVDVNGIIDPNFISSNLDSNSFSSMKQLANNNVLIAYYDSSVSKYYLKKYSYQGQEDNTFGNQGRINLDFSPSEIKVNNLDEIFVLERKTGTQQVIKKYFPNGLVDTTFGTNGIFDISSFNTGKTINVNNIDLDSNSNILLFGGTVGEANSFIARINSNGGLDTTFHGNLAYFITPDMFGSNLSGKVINDNEYRCFNREVGTGSVNYRSFKYIRNASPALGVQDIAYNNKIKIYPNPASDFITIQIGKNDKISKVTIYTITGELVLAANKSEINIKHLAIGHYLLEATVNNKIYTSKFIKK